MPNRTKWTVTVVAANKLEPREDKLSGRFRRKAVKVAAAQARVAREAGRMARSSAASRIERVPLHRSGGRYAAERLIASCDWPPFPRSGVDGFAVRSADVADAKPDSPAMLRVIDSIAAGDEPLTEVETGTAIRIMTGAMVPGKADAVVMLEQTSDAGAGIDLRRAGQTNANAKKHAIVGVKQPVSAGQNVAPAGEELQAGDSLIGPGVRIKPGHVALLGTFGYAEVPVYAKPRVAIFATGSELLAIDQPLRPGQIRDSNSGMIAAMVEQSGGEAILCGRLPDEMSAVRRALANALLSADMIVTTGGVSVGDYDVMAELLRQLPHYAEGSSSDTFAPAASNAVPQETTARSAFGTEAMKVSCETDEGDEDMLLFDRVSMRPGSPTSSARIGGKLVFALSGNPGACFVGFELFVRPAVLALQGEANPLPRTVRAELASGFEKGSPHDRYVRSRLYEADGRRYAEPLAFAKSSMMVSISAADGLALIPSGSAGAKAGQLVDVLLLPQ